jgi:hypothetical protein
MKLVDLDGVMYVPVVDETHGGATYEMKMTVGELFEKCCAGFEPEAVDAIPVDWLRHRLTMTQKHGSAHPEQAIRYVLWLWEQQKDREQGAQDG